MTADNPHVVCHPGVMIIRPRQIIHNGMAEFRAMVDVSMLIACPRGCAERSVANFRQRKAEKRRAYVEPVLNKDDQRSIAAVAKIRCY